MTLLPAGSRAGQQVLRPPDPLPPIEPAVERARSAHRYAQRPATARGTSAPQRMRAMWATDVGHILEVGVGLDPITLHP
jgi:hypothetical protein